MNKNQREKISSAVGVHFDSAISFEKPSQDVEMRPSIPLATTILHDQNETLNT